MIDALLYAATLTVIVRHALLTALRERGRLEERTAPVERWARLVLRAAPELRTITLDGYAELTACAYEDSLQ